MTERRTSTRSRPAPADTIRERSRELLEREAPARGERWIVAFSGGPDSTALAAVLSPLAAERGVELLLVHVDHGLDPGSRKRAERARAIAAELGLPFEMERIDVPTHRERHESPESAARRLRYAALERRRAASGARLVLTAHHRDDQIETLLLQLARGAPLEQLTGIAAVRGTLRRPLLGVPRADLLAGLSAWRIAPVEDPTNADRGIPRNRLRHEILPRLREREPGLEEALLSLAGRTQALQEKSDLLFRERLNDARAAMEEKESGPARRARDQVPADWLLELPEPLQLPALRWLLHGLMGASRLPSLHSLESFLRQLRGQLAARLRLPGDAAEELVAARGMLCRTRPRSRTPPFTYSFLIPGEVELPELGRRLRIRRSRVEPWMWQGDPERAALAGEAARATVRNRLPGDRLRPLGAPGARKLKALLIDRQVPPERRDRLPLVELDGRLAWVPGVAIDDAFRLTGETECWVAELLPASPLLAEDEGRSERTSIT